MSWTASGKPQGACCTDVLRLRLGWVMVCAALITTSATMLHAQQRYQNETAFQNGFNQYAGCRMFAGSDLVRRERADINGITLVFADPQLPGENVEVQSARLEMVFLEEGWGRVSTATLALYDAADSGKDVKPLSVVQYAQKKLVGMDAATKVVSWDISASIIKRWLDDPESNQGLRLAVTAEGQDRFQFIFAGAEASFASKRPRLAVKYSFTGNVPPYPPDLVTGVAGKTLGPRFTVEWRKKELWDANGTGATCELAVGLAGQGPFEMLVHADAAVSSAVLPTENLEPGKAYELRIRAVDSEGATSAWVSAQGSFQVTRKEVAFWPQNSVTKVQRRENPPDAPAAAAVLAAARNEYESFQAVVSAFSDLTDVDVSISDLVGPGGARIPASAVVLYRVNYVDCEGLGWLPDSLVPLVDPNTGRRIGGTHGAPFSLRGGDNVAVWAELHVPTDAAAGDYEAAATVSVGGRPTGRIPVKLTVWPVTLPKTTTLFTYFELTWRDPTRAYLNALHEHRIDVWFISELGHALKREDGKPVVQWNPEFDRALDAYFDGSMFADGVPGKTYLMPGSASWDIHKTMQSDSDDDRIEILKQYEAHYKDKPYVDKLAWFFIDEPNERTLAKCRRVGQQIKQLSPHFKFLLTTRYNKDLVGLVDVWDAIVNREVIDWNAPGPEPYRQEMKLGRRVINCITVNCDVPTSPNLFIHHTGMNTRIWPWVTFCLDQQGLEFWRANPAPSVTQPKKFGDTWGDGSLFYRGLP